ncbi:Protein kinase domain-containing protein [Cladophialophora immunda]|nr:Protein kinase domain-containing protein [Cladophialophora immunda]
MHRDIKPDNVMMGVVEGDGKSARWLCKFTDHGAVKVTGQLVTGRAGSPFYCAPEILDRKPYGERVDVWFLGVLFVVLFTGHDPIRDNPYVDIYPQSSSELDDRDDNMSISTTGAWAPDPGEDDAPATPKAPSDDDELPSVPYTPDYDDKATHPAPVQEVYDFTNNE